VFDAIDAMPAAAWFGGVAALTAMAFLAGWRQ
jgi:hypothetical protein